MIIPRISHQVDRHAHLSQCTIHFHGLPQRIGRVALALQQRKGHYDKRLVAYSATAYFQEGLKLAPATQPAK